MYIILNKFFLLVSFTFLLAIGYGQCGICKPDIRKLENFICQAMKYYFPSVVPAAAPALYFLEKYFSAKGADKDWEHLKSDVEKWIGEQLDQQKLRDLEIWHQSMKARIATCVAKFDVHLKRSCLRNLQEDLSGYEPRFRGANDKEKCLYLKHYDIFVLTYLSVSETLQSISNGTLKASIAKDVALKAKIFHDYLRDAVPAGKRYACRIIKIDIEREMLFWWTHVRYWPVQKSFYKKADELKTEKRSTFHRGCGALTKSVMFQSTVVNTAKKSILSGPWKYIACSTSEGVTNTVMLARSAWFKEYSMCQEKLATGLWGRIDARVKMLEHLF